jgi:hypothetical protein
MVIKLPQKCYLFYPGLYSQILIWAWEWQYFSFEVKFPLKSHNYDCSEPDNARILYKKPIKSIKIKLKYFISGFVLSVIFRSFLNSIVREMNIFIL